MSKKLFSATTHCENGLCSQKAIFAKDEFKTRSLKVQLGVLRGEIRARGGVVPQSLRSKEKERAAAKEAKEKRREEARREEARREDGPPEELRGEESDATAALEDE